MNTLPAGSYRIQATFGTNAVPDWVAETVPITIGGQLTRGANYGDSGGFPEVAVRSTKDGKPIEDVGVNAFKEGYQTGLLEQQRRGRPQAPTWRISGQHLQTRLAAGQCLGSVESGKTNRVEIELSPARKLAGIVRSPDGQPATNLAVLVVGDYSMQQANLKTGPDGRFEMEWNSQRFPGTT